MARVGSFLREGDQLLLDLFPGEPWAGCSPRGLTRGLDLLSLRRESGGHEVEPDPTQLLLFGGEPKAIRKKRLPAAPGAPSLAKLFRKSRPCRARSSLEFYER